MGGFVCCLGIRTLQRVGPEMVTQLYKGGIGDRCNDRNKMEDQENRSVWSATRRLHCDIDSVANHALTR